MVHRSPYRPALIPIQPPSRVSKPGSEKSFLDQTLRTPYTVIACQSLYQPSSTSSFKADLGEMQTLFRFGSGLNGHEDHAHGGFIALMLGEIMGLIVRLYSEAKNPYTAYMNVTFKKALTTPGVVLCRAWVTGMEGRKMWVKGTVEDERGVPYAIGESLFVDVKSKI